MCFVNGGVAYHFSMNSNRPLSPATIARAAFIGAILQTIVARAEILNIAGSTVLNVAIADVAQILRTERGMEIHVNTAGGTSGGVRSLADRSAQIAMTSRAVTPED